QNPAYRPASLHFPRRPSAALAHRSAEPTSVPFGTTGGRPSRFTLQIAGKRLILRELVGFNPHELSRLSPCCDKKNRSGSLALPSAFHVEWRRVQISAILWEETP